MKNVGFDNFEAAAGETITVQVTVDKPPYLCAFADQPSGTTWNTISHVAGSLEEQRDFKMPNATNAQVRLDVRFDTQIAEGDDNPKATYTLKFSGSAPGSEVVTRQVVVSIDM